MTWRTRFFWRGKSRGPAGAPGQAPLSRSFTSRTRSMSRLIPALLPGLLRAACASPAPAPDAPLEGRWAMDTLTGFEYSPAGALAATHGPFALPG